MHVPMYARMCKEPDSRYVACAGTTRTEEYNEREKERKTEREREKKRGSVCVCVVLWELSSETLRANLLGKP